MNKIKQQIIMGSLLGDGCIHNGTTTFRYVEAHSIKQQDYLMWKNKFLGYNFKEFIKENKRYVKIDKGNKKELAKIYYLFYKNNKKRVTKRILNKLEPLALAVWYMDDGHYNYRGKTVDLYTLGFGLIQNKLIKNWLKERFNLDCKIRKHGGKHRKGDKIHYISFSTSKGKKFLNIVKPYMPPSMNYKLGGDKQKIKDAKKKINEHYTKNRDGLLIYKKNYYFRNRDKFLRLFKEYREKNKDKIREGKRDYYRRNKDRVLKKNREYREEMKNLQP